MDGARYIGWAGSLTVALGVAGVGVLPPAIGWAQPTGSGAGATSESPGPGPGAGTSPGADRAAGADRRTGGDAGDDGPGSGDRSADDTDPAEATEGDDADLVVEAVDAALDEAGEEVADAEESVDETTAVVEDLPDEDLPGDENIEFSGPPAAPERERRGGLVTASPGDGQREPSSTDADADPTPVPVSADPIVADSTAADADEELAVDAAAAVVAASLPPAAQVALLPPAAQVASLPPAAQAATTAATAPAAQPPIAPAALTPLVVPRAPAAPAPSPAPLAMYAWTRRETEQALLDRSAEGSTAQPGVAANPTRNWFQRTFFAASPTFAPQALSVNLAPGASSTPFALGAEDADTATLTYTLAGAGGGTAAGTLTIAGESATYTAAPGWDGVTPYADTFTVTASDDDGGFHVHGFAGLVYRLTFGLFGTAGHTATSTVTVTVLPVAGPEPEPDPDPPDAPVPAGSFPVSFSNDTGTYGDDAVHVMVIGQVTPGQWSWVDRDGTAHAIDHAAAEAPGHLEKNGVNYADMSFTLADADNFRVPPELLGGRIYLSLGQPLYVAVSVDNTGWASPDPANPTDPNYDTVYDWYELSFKNGSVPFGGNTTQVDQFGFPFTFTVTQDASGFSGTRGIALSRDELFRRFEDTVPAEFQTLVIRDADGDPLRILAPRSQLPGDLATWLDEPVEVFWTKYAHEQFAYAGPGFTVTGGIDGQGRFAYTVTGAGGGATSHTMDRPSTRDVFRADGPFVGTGLQGAFLAALDAAFNRGVATSPEDWDDASAYYPAGQRWNDWAQFFHANSVDGYAYGFPYDDVNSQSSVLILGNPDPLSDLRLRLAPTGGSAP